MASTSQRLEKLQNIEKVREIRGITTPRQLFGFLCFDILSCLSFHQSHKPHPVRSTIASRVSPIMTIYGPQQRSLSALAACRYLKAIGAVEWTGLGLRDYLPTHLAFPTFHFSSLFSPFLLPLVIANYHSTPITVSWSQTLGESGSTRLLHTTPRCFLIHRLSLLHSVASP